MKLTSITAALMLIASPLVAADEMTVMLDWFVNPDHGPIIIAQEKGYFAEQDLAVKIVAPADPSDPPKLVAAGKADLAISYQPQLHLQIHEGLPLKRVGTLVATPLNCLLTLADGPVKSPADLAGKKVGFSVGGVESALLDAVLRNNGLSLEDIELVNVNWSLSPSLMSGQVDAVIGAFRNFELNQMDIEGVLPSSSLITHRKAGRFLQAPHPNCKMILTNAPGRIPFPALRCARPRWTRGAIPRLKRSCSAQA